MDSPHNSQGEETLWSSRLEVLIAISRVTEAIEALPSLPDNLTVRRWNHGIGRELWIAIGAIGLEGAASITAYSQQSNISATVACPPLVHLFRVVSWRHRRLAFDMSQLDHATFLSSARALLQAPVGGGEDWGFPKWWKWSGGTSEEGKQMPGWWNFPTVDVGPPMPLFETDRADIEAEAGKAYKIIGAILFQKECKLQEVEGRMTELKLSLSDE